MHPAAHEYVKQFATDKKVRVIDIGSRNINGTVRDLFPNATYTGVDIVKGKNVDVVADAVVWKPKALADIVVCCEMIEHCENWRDLIANIVDNMLKANGVLIITAANLNRAPHSGVDGGQVREGEFYANIDPLELGDVLKMAGFDAAIDIAGDDVRAYAVKE